MSKEHAPEPLEIEIYGEEYGGQYWSREEFQFTATLEDDNVVLRLLTTWGDERNAVTLTRQQALDLSALHANTPPPALTKEIPGLSQTLTLTMAGHSWHAKAPMSALVDWIDEALTS